MKDNRLIEMRVMRSVVETGGFSAAARQMGVSQAFISQVVNRVEKRLGVKLLHRSTRSQRLTAEGEYYVKEAIKITDRVDFFESDFLNQSSQVTGLLRVTVPVAFGYDQILPRIPQFMDQHPEIKVIINLNDEVCNLIDSGYDIAIRMGELDNSSMKIRKLCDLRRAVVASPAYVAKFSQPREPSDLASHNCLMWYGRRDSLNRWSFAVDGEEQVITAKGNFGSTDGLALTHQCLQGRGIMRMAEHLAMPYIRKGKLVHLLKSYEITGQTAIHAMYLPERDLLPRIRVFVGFMVECFREPPWINYEL